jgi:hypothetical protein
MQENAVMVQIKRWIGRSGNCLFQYCAARIIAENNGLYLDVQWPFNDLVEVIPRVGGKKVNDKTFITEIIDIRGGTAEGDLLQGDFKRRWVKMEGYFQNVHFYNNRRDEIRTWFNLPEIKRNTEDIVLHYRVGDYYWSRVASVIAPQWYDKCLHREGFYGNRRCNVYIVTEDPDDANVRHLINKTHGKVIHGTSAEDFHFIRSFDRIIMGNSSFSWWAAFLGTPRTVYTFRNWMRKPRLNLAQFPGAIIMPGYWTNDEVKSKIDYGKTGYYENKKNT